MDLDPSLKNVCRVCRDGSVTLVDIFNGVDADEDHEKNLAYVLSQCTNCQVNRDDLLPKQICLSCVLAAQNAFRFKKTCEQSHQHFCEILQMRWHRSQVEELVFNEDNVDNAGGLRVIDASCIKLEPMSELQEYAMQENSQIEIPSTEEQEHTTDEVFSHVCQYCTKGFRGSYELNNHIRSRHTGERPFECPHCPKKFATINYLRNHIRLHTGERPYKCPHCPKAYTLWNSLKAHISTHGGSHRNLITKLFRCDQCAASFRDHIELSMHKQLKHRINNTTAEAKSKEKPIENITEPSTSCPTTNSSNVGLSKSVLKEGKAKIKKEPAKKIQSQQQNSAHIIRRNYRCPYTECSRAFQTDLELKQHILTHTSEWQFQCKGCSKGYYTKCKLDDHIRVRHSADRKFECSQCQQKFTSKKSLRLHISIIHTEDVQHLSTAPQMEQTNDYQGSIKSEVPERNSPHESPLLEQILPD